MKVTCILSHEIDRTDGEVKAVDCVKDQRVSRKTGRRSGREDV